jgi:hypothetical protein
VVRVNRTTIRDTDEQGNTFFFSSAVHHVLQDGEPREEGDLAELPTDAPEEEIQKDSSDYNEDAEIVPTDIDETENEVTDNDEALMQVPEGDATANVAGIFE